MVQLGVISFSVFESTWSNATNLPAELAAFCCRGRGTPGETKLENKLVLYSYRCLLFHLFSQPPPIQWSSVKKVEAKKKEIPHAGPKLVNFIAEAIKTKEQVYNRE